MRKILGLDLGVASIGWALVNEPETDTETGSIIDAGVRVVPLTNDESDNFKKGKSITTNADRTLKRSARRNWQRFKLRRKALLLTLKREGWIDDSFSFSENDTHASLELRAKAAREKVSLEELARVLLMINKKRGYKSSRKGPKDAEIESSGEEGGLGVLGAIEIARLLTKENITPGEYLLRALQSGKKEKPEFFRSDLEREWNQIASKQAELHPEIFSTKFIDAIREQAENRTFGIAKGEFNLYGSDLKGAKNKQEQELLLANWRVQALSTKIDPEKTLTVLAKLNGQIKASSGYLSKIADLSKTIHLNRQTVGEYLWNRIQTNPHQSIKNTIFYRTDYQAEFDTIWNTQKQFHPNKLTDELKNELRDRVIFFQRRLKSQKGLLSFCTFEQQKKMVTDSEGKLKEKTIGLRVAPRSSPLFQEVKILQQINNLKVENEDRTSSSLDYESRLLLYRELRVCSGATVKDVSSWLGLSKTQKLNMREKLEGNRTIGDLIKVFSRILETEYGMKLNLKKGALPSEHCRSLKDAMRNAGLDPMLIEFDATLGGHGKEDDLSRQPSYILWNMLFSYVEDESPTGLETLIIALQKKFNLSRNAAMQLAALPVDDAYGELSAKAMKKILPNLLEGFRYDEACEKAGYNHSFSLDKQANADRTLDDLLKVLPKNSLRNPVVEKILNQLVHVVNGVIQHYGKPAEIRIELARELKASASEREKATQNIAKATKEHEKIREILVKEFRIPNPSRKDIIKYRLYCELESLGYKGIYSGRQIVRERLFSKDYDIEHIIPQSLLFDDSFSNKTIETREVNLEKGNRTAIDYVRDKKGDIGVAEYKQRVELFAKGKNGDTPSRVKIKRLLMKQSEIPKEFLNRDLRDSQYIARKARELMLTVVRDVNTTTGAVTDKLRKYWGLENVLMELNWDKYQKIDPELTYYIENKENKKLRRIKDWTKRNDHRHHAMDAITVAFTRPAAVKYLNTLNARGEEVEEGKGNDEFGGIYLNHVGKKAFTPPMDPNQLRAEVKGVLENILVSHKAKNKVLSRNVNRVKTKTGEKKYIEMTPRGAIHKETVYGMRRVLKKEPRKINAEFTEAFIHEFVPRENQRRALLARLAEYNGDPKAAFTGKNAPAKNPIYLDADRQFSLPEVLTLHRWEEQAVKRVPIQKITDQNVEKVLDEGLKNKILQHVKKYDNFKQAWEALSEDPIFTDSNRLSSVKRVILIDSVNPHVIRPRQVTPAGILGPDYVDLQNNHHVALYKNPETGAIEESLVRFHEAIHRRLSGAPVVYQENEKGWPLWYSLKQNEFFVFPDAKTGFNPAEEDLLAPENRSKISPHIFRVQSKSGLDYQFRHHLETDSIKNKHLLGFTWKRIRSFGPLKGIVKVRLNHLGHIVHVGEY